MAQERSPAFQFYPKDFLSDGNQAGMSLSEVGAYSRLLCICWLECSIPDDVVRIARMVGATPAQMKKMWPAVRSCFKPHPSVPGRLIHGRLERERQAQESYRQRQSANGRKGGRPKKPAESHSKPTANPVESESEAIESSPSPIPSTSLPERSPEERVRPRDGARRDLAFAGNVLEVPRFLDDDFLKKLNGNYFDLTGFYLALDTELAQTGKPWDLAWIRMRFAEEAPSPERKNGHRSKRVAEQYPAERRSWRLDCHHEPPCSSYDWHCIRLEKETAAP